MFCEKKGFSIKYTALYLHKKNKLAKQGQCTIVIIKDLMLINNELLNRFWTEKIKTTNYLQNKLLTKSKNHSKLISKEV